MKKILLFFISLFLLTSCASDDINYSDNIDVNSNDNVLVTLFDENNIFVDKNIQSKINDIFDSSENDFLSFFSKTHNILGIKLDIKDLPLYGSDESISSASKVIFVSTDYCQLCKTEIDQYLSKILKINKSIDFVNYIFGGDSVVELFYPNTITDSNFSISTNSTDFEEWLSTNNIAISPLFLFVDENNFVQYAYAGLLTPNDFTIALDIYSLGVNWKTVETVNGTGISTYFHAIDSANSYLSSLKHISVPSSFFK